MTLTELSQEFYYSTDKQTTHKYLDVYDQLFLPFHNEVCTILELGYATGGSIELWKDYFKRGFIVCLDKDESNFVGHGENVTLIQCDINELTEKDFEHINFDIAIDDGSHFVSDQIRFIELIWPVINSGGMLIIEDVFDIETYKKEFDALNIPFEIVDLREQSGHTDSVLLIFRK
jgi:hypothetical protein